jgi:hypothetical protein
MIMKASDLSDLNNLFISTRFMTTKNQVRGKCSGDSTRDGICNCSLKSLDLCCPKGKMVENGFLTGLCSNGATCDIEGWCPTESETDDTISEQSYVVGVEDMILYMRLDAVYVEMGRTMNNVDERGYVRGVNFKT